MKPTKPKEARTTNLERGAALGGEEVPGPAPGATEAAPPATLECATPEDWAARIGEVTNTGTRYRSRLNLVVRQVMQQVNGDWQAHARWKQQLGALRVQEVVPEPMERCFEPRHLTLQTRALVVAGGARVVLEHVSHYGLTSAGVALYRGGTLLGTLETGQTPGTPEAKGGQTLIMAKLDEWFGAMALDARV